MKNEQKYYKTHSYKRHPYVNTIASKRLLDNMLSTPLIIKNTTYGNDAARLGAPSTDSAQSTTIERGRPEGTASAMIAQTNQQGWAEFLIMPMFDPRADPCILDVARLFDKCVSDLPRTTMTNPTGGASLHPVMATTLFSAYKGKDYLYRTMYNSTNISDGTTGLHVLFQNEFIYYGGSQSHTFTNNNEVAVNIELTEFTPLRPMKQFITDPHQIATGTSQNLGQMFQPIATYIREDNMYSKPQSNTNTQYAALTTSKTIDDDPFDYEFKIKGPMNFTATHYRWTKPKFVRLDPGDTYTHVVHIPPFRINIGEVLTQSMDFNRGYGTPGYASYPFSNNETTEWQHVFKDSFPMFTRTLVVRYWGNRMFARVADNTTGIVRNVTSTATVSLAHQQTEHHKARVLPVIIKPRYIVNNRITTMADGFVDDLNTIGRYINPESNTFQNPEETPGADDDVGLFNMPNFAPNVNTNRELEDDTVGYQP